MRSALLRDICDINNNYKLSLAIEIMPESIVDKVAKVARLELTEAEKKKFEKDMHEILKAFGSLDKAKTDGVEPAFQPIETKTHCATM